MEDESETGFCQCLNFFERFDGGSYVLRGRIALVPICQDPIAKVFIYRSVMLFDNILASGKPAANQRGQSFTHKDAAKRRKIHDVRDHEPARHVLDLLDGSLRNRGLILRQNLLRFSKNKLSAADQDLVLIVESNRLMNASLVQKGSIATAQIDEPELADVLQLDERMHSGDFRRVQNEGIGGSSSHRTSPAKDVAFAVRF